MYLNETVIKQNHKSDKLEKEDSMSVIECEWVCLNTS